MAFDIPVVGHWLGQREIQSRIRWFDRAIQAPQAELEPTLTHSQFVSILSVVVLCLSCCCFGSFFNDGVCRVWVFCFGEVV